MNAIQNAVKPESMKEENLQKILKCFKMKFYLDPLFIVSFSDKINRFEDLNRVDLRKRYNILGINHNWFFPISNMYFYTSIGIIIL